MLETGLATYPDASVVCGPTERDPDKKTNAVNPRVLIEITTDGTEHYDRGEKLEHYKRIPALEAVVIVSHREPLLEVWSRTPGSSTWTRAETHTGQAATIPPLRCALDVDSIWRAAAEPV